MKLRARFVLLCCVLASFLAAPPYVAQPNSEEDPPGLTLEVGDSPLAPEALRPGDVVMGVDGESLRYYVRRLAAPPDGGGQGGGS